MHYIRIYAYIFMLWVTHGDARGLLLALHTGITSDKDRVRGPFGVLGIKPRSSSYITCALPTVLSFWPLGIIFLINIAFSTLSQVFSLVPRK